MVNIEKNHEMKIKNNYYNTDFQTTFDNLGVK